MTALAKLTALVGCTDSGYLDAHFDLNAGHDDIARAVYAEIRGERDAEIIAWLGKKAAEYRAAGSRDQKLQANAIDTMASKIWRGAVRPNNVLGVVTRASVLREITDRLARRATLYGDSRTVNEVMRDLDRLATEADAGTGAAPSGETTQPDYRAAVAEALRLLETAPEAFQAAPSQNITAAAGILRRARELGGGE